MMRFFHRNQRFFLILIFFALITMGISPLMMNVLMGLRMPWQHKTSQEIMGTAFGEEVATPEFVQTHERLTRHLRYLAEPPIGVPLSSTDGNQEPQLFYYLSLISEHIEGGSLQGVSGQEVWEHVILLRHCDRLGVMVGDQELAAALVEVYKQRVAREKAWQAVQMLAAIEGRGRQFWQLYQPYQERFHQELAQVKFDRADYMRRFELFFARAVEHKRAGTAPSMAEFEQTYRERLRVRKLLQLIQDSAPLPPDLVRERFLEDGHERRITYAELRAASQIPDHLALPVRNGRDYFAAHSEDFAQGGAIPRYEDVEAQVLSRLTKEHQDDLQRYYEITRSQFEVVSALRAEAEPAARGKLEALREKVLDRLEAGQGVALADLQGADKDAPGGAKVGGVTAVALEGRARAQAPDGADATALAEGTCGPIREREGRLAFLVMLKRQAAPELDAVQGEAQKALEEDLEAGLRQYYQDHEPQFRAPSKLRFDALRLGVEVAVAHLDPRGPDLIETWYKENRPQRFRNPAAQGPDRHRPLEALRDELIIIHQLRPRTENADKALMAAAGETDWKTVALNTPGLRYREVSGTLDELRYDEAIGPALRFAGALREDDQPSAPLLTYGKGRFIYRVQSRRPATPDTLSVEYLWAPLEAYKKRVTAFRYGLVKDAILRGRDDLLAAAKKLQPGGDLKAAAGGYEALRHGRVDDATREALAANAELDSPGLAAALKTLREGELSAVLENEQRGALILRAVGEKRGQREGYTLDVLAADYADHGGLLPPPSDEALRQLYEQRKGDLLCTEQPATYRPLAEVAGEVLEGLRQEQIDEYFERTMDALKLEVGASDKKAATLAALAHKQGLGWFPDQVATTDEIPDLPQIGCGGLKELLAKAAPESVSPVVRRPTDDARVLAVVRANDVGELPPFEDVRPKVLVALAKEQDEQIQSYYRRNQTRWVEHGDRYVVEAVHGDFLELGKTRAQDPMPDEVALKQAFERHQAKYPGQSQGEIKDDLVALVRGEAEAQVRFEAFEADLKAVAAEAGKRPDLAELAKKHALSYVKTTASEAGVLLGLPALKNSTEIYNHMTKMQPGELSGRFQTQQSTGLTIYRLVEKFRDRQRPLADVHDEVVKGLLKEQQLERARERAKALQDELLAAPAQFPRLLLGYGLKPKRSEFFNRRGDVPGADSGHNLSVKAFGLAPGEVGEMLSDEAEGKQLFAFLRFEERRDPDPKALDDDKRKEIKAALLQTEGPKYRDRWVVDLMLQALALSPAELEQEFADHPGRQSVRARQILIKTDQLEQRKAAFPAEQAERDGREILERLKAGAAFEELARQRSDDETSAANGGLLGGLSQVQERFSPALRDEAAKLADAALSDLVRTSFGLHLLKREGAAADTAHYRHILLNLTTRTPQAADIEALEKPYRSRLAALRERIVKGEDFAALARKESEDPDSKAKGGDLGSIDYDDRKLPEPVRDAALALEAGAISEVLRSEEGFHLLKVEKVERKQARDFWPELFVKVFRRTSFDFEQGRWKTGPRTERVQ